MGKFISARIHVRSGFCQVRFQNHIKKWSIDICEILRLFFSENNRNYCGINKKT